MKTILKILAISTFAHLHISTLIYAQNYQWAKSIGGTSVDESYSIALDDTGNVYVTGWFEDTADFNPGPGTANLISAGLDDIFFAKYSSSGDYIWAKSIGGGANDRAYSIALDDTGNMYITGYFFDTVDFDPGPGTADLTSAGLVDIFFAKYSSSGDYIWAKKLGGIVNDEGSSIALDDTGNVYVTGRFQGTADFDPGPGTADLISAGGNDIFFAKYSSAGNYLWAKRAGGTSGDGSTSIALDDTSNVYVTGDFGGTADFDPGSGTVNLTSAGSVEIFFAKYNSSGDYIWAKSLGGTSWDDGFAIALDGMGNVYVTGYFMSTADFDPGPGTANLTSAGGFDIFFAKYSSDSGNYLWAKRLGGIDWDASTSIALDDTGNVYVTGFFRFAADFDPGAGTANLTSAGGFDIFFAKYSTSGDYLWAKRLGGTSDDYSLSIALDGMGNVYITGDFGGTADFDPGSGTVNLTSAGFADIFFTKYGSATFPAIKPIEFLSHLNIYPNPNTGELIVEIDDLCLPVCQYELRLYNMLGTEMLKFKISNQKSKIDLSRYTKGIYIIQLAGEEGRVINKKIVID